MDKSAVLDVQFLQQVLVEYHSQVMVSCCSFPENETRRMSTYMEMLLIAGGYNMETKGVSSPLLLLYPARQVVPDFHGQNILVIQFI